MFSNASGRTRIAVTTAAIAVCLVLSGWMSGEWRWSLLFPAAVVAAVSAWLWRRDNRIAVPPGGRQANATGQTPGEAAPDAGPAPGL